MFPDLFEWAKETVTFGWNNISKKKNIFCCWKTLKIVKKSKQSVSRRELKEEGSKLMVKYGLVQNVRTEKGYLSFNDMGKCWSIFADFSPLS